MLLPRRTAAAPALLLAALLALPGAAAQPVSAQVLVHELRFEAAAEQAGTLAFLHVESDPLAPAAPALHAQGRHIETLQYDDDGVEEQTSDIGTDQVHGQDQDTLRLLNSVRPNPGHPESADGARLDAQEAASAYRLNLFAADVALAGRVQEAGQSVLQHPSLTKNGIREENSQGTGIPVPTPAILAPKSGSSGYWTSPPAQGAHVLTEARGATLRITGTFTLEVMGLGFRLADKDHSVELQSGTTRHGLGPVAVGPVDDHLHAVRESFLRITVTDGVLELAVPHGAVQWSGVASDSTAAAATLDEATGSVRLADGHEQRLTGASYRLDGRYAFQANPAQQGLQLAVMGLDDAGQPLLPTAQTVRLAASPIYWVAAAGVAASAGITFLILGLLRRQPTMSDVESALEAGHFRRAARDAGRLLRRRPGFEDALLSRAVALAKLGRNRRVVREIREHFATAEPSDGVLHYVLGLALKETGAVADAQAAWREALRRTPSLLPQVQPLLSGQQASSPASTVAPVVDGTAYA